MEDKLYLPIIISVPSCEIGMVLLFVSQYPIFGFMPMDSKRNNLVDVRSLGKTIKDKIKRGRIGCSDCNYADFLINSRLDRMRDRLRIK